MPQDQVPLSLEEMCPIIKVSANDTWTTCVVYFPTSGEMDWEEDGIVIARSSGRAVVVDHGWVEVQMPAKTGLLSDAAVFRVPIKDCSFLYVDLKKQAALAEWLEAEEARFEARRRAGGLFTRQLRRGEVGSAN